MGTALATPPTPGSAAVLFDDPYFGQTVVCDTLAQVQEIATAAIPNVVFRQYRDTPNEKGYPTCIAAAFSADVGDVTPIGIMHWDKNAFKAWAIKVGTNKLTGYALYLELFKEVNL